MFDWRFNSPKIFMGIALFCLIGGLLGLVITEDCSTCDGTGECPICDGTGVRPYGTCAVCDGTGLCYTCDGDGKVPMISLTLLGCCGFAFFGAIALALFFILRKQPVQYASAPPPVQVQERRPEAGIPKFCTGCGSPITEVDLFCEKCGQKTK